MPEEYANKHLLSQITQQK